MDIINFWNMVEKSTGRVFRTISGLEFTYTFHEDYIVVSRAKTTRLYRSSFEKALNMNYSNYKDLDMAGIHGHVYVYVIIETLIKETKSSDCDDGILDKPSNILERKDMVETSPVEAPVETNNRMSFGKWLVKGFISYLVRTRVYSVTTIGRDSHGRRYSSRRYKIVHRVF